MEEIIPCDEWGGVIKPYYPKGKRNSRVAVGHRVDVRYVSQLTV